MEFEIYVSHKLKTWHLKVELFYWSDQIQRYRIHGQKSTIVLQNNYPLLASTNSLRKKISWKLTEGLITDASLLLQIIQELERELKPKTRMPNKKDW